MERDPDVGIEPVTVVTRPNCVVPLQRVASNLT